MTAVGIILACLCVIAIVWAICVNQQCGVNNKDFFDGTQGIEAAEKVGEQRDPETERKLKNDARI